jgi:60S ribosome subunit biogenesis protein NIP7
MRPLTDEEMRVFFEKLQSYIGSNITKLIDRTDEPYTFRIVTKPPFVFLFV